MLCPAELFIVTCVGDDGDVLIVFRLIVIGPISVSLAAAREGWVVRLLLAELNKSAGLFCTPPDLILNEITQAASISSRRFQHSLPVTRRLPTAGTPISLTSFFCLFIVGAWRFAVCKGPRLDHD